MTLEQYVRKGSFYKTVVEDGSDLIFVVDYKGKISYHNGSVRGTLGYRSRSLVGKNFFDFILPETVDELRGKFQESAKKPFTQNVEFQFLAADHSYRFLEFNAINLKHRENVKGFILDCRDITERKRNAEELVRLQKAKEQFLANISHEIRTPINGIAGMADLLGHNTSDEERNTYLNAIRHSAENLKVIINDILDLAAIESGKLRFEKIAFNLSDLVPALVGTFTYQAREKRLQLDYTIDKSLSRLFLGDPVRLNQILINLVGNAVKFTFKGSIHVTCALQRKHKNTWWIQFEVTDTGIGIPSDKLDTIFDSFSQADETFTRKYGGSGLGLTIVRQLVELQRGTIQVRSKEDHGSTFTVTIPYQVARHKAIPAESSHETLVHDFSQPAYVLLVEDNDINRLYAGSILKKWHCRVDTAENGLVAVEKIKNNDYDLVLMDVQMPVMDGYEATKAIRQLNSEKRNVKVIALTANATPSDIEKCLQAGMNDYLAKPFTPDELMSKISRDSARSANPTPVPGTNGEKTTFDLAYLRSMSNNDEGFVREMMQTFVQTVPAVLNEMRIAAENGNWERLGKLAHQIKPSFMLLGITHLRSAILFIEENGKAARELARLRRTTNDFIQATKTVLKEFNRELTVS